MASSLSSYWVKFFTAAGFPLDVATKHAVVFSNNRIKPDMLPDLDKPSLKEMGIVLMGDMIAILRYAKKVSEEMTCERFLVDSVDPSLSLNSNNTDNKLSKINKINPTKSTVVKKLPSKVTNVSKIADSSKTKSQVVAKNNLKVKPNIVVTGLKKKTVGSTRVVAPIKKPEDLQAKKRKLEIETIDSDSEESDEDLDLKLNKRLKSDESKINYKVIMNRPTNVPTKESLNVAQKKLIDQKRTVFDRLGDSSVTSTTNLIDSTTFNITGIGNDVVKRNSGVFKRLGDKDKKDVSAGILKNEINGKLNQPQGILKNKPNNVGTTSIKLVKNLGKSGTMHADHESKKKIVSSSIKQLVRTTKAMKLNSVTSTITRKIPNNKLASERLSNLPAKARLGMGMKQVTFNKVATVAHIKKPDVFSRLGV